MINSVCPDSYSFLHLLRYSQMLVHAEDRSGTGVDDDAGFLIWNPWSRSENENGVDLAGGEDWTVDGAQVIGFDAA